ncbi:MAG: hypothetical protein ACYSW3_02050 [Planctomycetota bacterium]|jgi:hypothetical protein
MQTERRKFKIYSFLTQVIPDGWEMTEVDRTIYLDYNRDRIGSKPLSAATISRKNPSIWNMSEGSTKKQERIVKKLIQLWEKYTSRQVTLTFPPLPLDNGYIIDENGDDNNDDD